MRTIFTFSSNGSRSPPHQKITRIQPSKKQRKKKERKWKERARSCGKGTERRSERTLLLAMSSRSTRTTNSFPTLSRVQSARKHREILDSGARSRVTCWIQKGKGSNTNTALRTFSFERCLSFSKARFERSFRSILETFSLVEAVSRTTTCEKRCAGFPFGSQ